MKVLFPYLLLLLASCAWCAGPKVATVYSSWGDYAFKHELDAPLAQLGWQQEAFENTRLTELSERLAEFDFVVTSGVANYEHTVDMAPFRKQWLDWLAAGGVLLITDASYGSVLDSWLNTFGPDYALGSTQCLALTKPGPESRQVKFAEGSLLTCPKDLRAGLEQAMDRIWAHLEPLQSQGWTTLATCADGKPLMVERHVGKGLLVVTSFYRFAEGNSPALAQGLLENLQLAALAARGGLELTEFELPPLAPGPIVIKLGLRNLAKVSRTVIAQARVGGEGEYTPQERIKATLAPGESRTLELPSVAGKRGQALLRVLVTDEKDATLLQWSRPMEIPPAIVARLKRTFLTLSNPQLELEIEINPDSTCKLEELQLHVGTGQGTTTLEAPSRRFRLDVPAMGLPNGEQNVTLSLRAGKGFLGDLRLPFSKLASPTVRLDEQGRTYIKGREFFPLGMYHVSWGYDAEARLAMLRDCASAGFNWVHVGVKPDEVESFGAFLDEAEKLGMKVGVEFGLDPALIIEKYKDHPAILTWNPGDEPDGQGVGPEEMQTRYDRFKRLDPNHPVYTTLCVPATYGDYVRGTDIAAPDPYPIPHSSVLMVWDYLSRAQREAEPYGTSVWGILQCFGEYGGWGRAPTPEELRAMTWLALLAGVKGLIYYTYADGSWEVQSHPEQWEAMKRITSELKEMGATSTGGPTELLLADSALGVFAGRKYARDTNWYVAVNGSSEERTITLETVRAGQFLAPFGGPTPVSTTQGLIVTLKPLEVMIVKRAPAL